MKRHLLTGAQYARWDAQLRFGYVRDLCEIVSALPKFRPTSRPGMEWRTVLRWWLDPVGASTVPNPQNVSAWYDYVRTNFEYRLNWALGSVVALAIDDAFEGDLHAPTLDEWPATGLPWIAFWLKELIVWGTLEPVAAFLLARGLETTRSDAEARARVYFSEQSLDDPNEELNPQIIREWSETRFTVNAPQLVSRMPVEMKVQLLRDFARVPPRLWRVVPVEVDEDLHWLDPAGFPLAKCRKPIGWEPGYLDVLDFTLEPSAAEVRSQLYG